jgi:hypothetical protein
MFELEDVLCQVSSVVCFRESDVFITVVEGSL